MGSSIRGRPNHWVLKPQTESMAVCQGMRVLRPPSLSIPASLSLFSRPSCMEQRGDAHEEGSWARRRISLGATDPIMRAKHFSFCITLRCLPPSSRGQPCLCLALRSGGEENEMEVHIGQNPNILQIICPHHQAPVSHIGITTKRNGKRRQHGETRPKIILGLAWQWAMSQYSVPAHIVTCAHVKSN